MITKLKKAILFFCAFLLAFFIIALPFSAYTLGTDSRFGINGFLINRYNEKERASAINSLNQMNVAWTREEFIWDEIEKTPGKFDWEKYDLAVSQLDRANLNILGIIDYSARWASADPESSEADKYPPDLSAWKRYVEKLVSRYGDKVHYWQIWNEPNIVTFFRPNPDSAKYFDILKVAFTAIKKIDSNASVVMAGTSGVDVGYLSILVDLGAGEYFDIMAVHPYGYTFRASPDENGLSDRLSQAVDLAKKFGDKKIWVTEFGWPNDVTEGVSSEDQASYLLQSYLIALSMPNIEKIFWYDLRDDGTNQYNREENFGLLKKDFSPKISFSAYEAMTKFLGNSLYVKTEHNNDGVWMMYFKRGKQKIKIVWKNGFAEKMLMEIDDQTKIYDYLGNQYLFSDELQQIEISKKPYYIISS